MALSSDNPIILEAGQELRDEFSCPITCDLMYDPVIAGDGHTYDRSAIQKWFTKHNTSPKTGQVLENLNLVENINLKRLITDLVDEGGLGLYSKPSVKPTSSAHDLENVKIDSNISGSSTGAQMSRVLIREKILILQCVESTTPGYSSAVYYVGQEGAEGGRIQKSIVFDKQFIQLLDDPTCSRRHFRIQYNEETKQFEINDLGSTSGVLVRIPYNDGYSLRKSDVICFGKHQLEVEGFGSMDKSITLKCIAPVGSPLENNIYCIGSEKREYTIGRNQNSDISFTVLSGESKLVGVDGAISSEHARIKCFSHQTSYDALRQQSTFEDTKNDTYEAKEEASLKFVLLDGSDRKPSSNGTWLRLSPINQVSRSYPLIEGSQFIVGGSRFKVSHGSTIKVVELQNK